MRVNSLSTRNRARVGYQDYAPMPAGLASAWTEADRATLESMVPQRPGESTQDYNYRITDLMATSPSGTNETVQDVARRAPAAPVDNTSRDIATAAGIITSVFGAASSLGVEAMRASSARDVAQINQVTQAAMAELQLRLAQANSPAQQELIRSQMAQLQATNERLAQRDTQWTPGLIIAGGLAAVVAIGGTVYFVTQRRKNPVVGRGRNRHFVPAKGGKRAKRAKRRAKR
jgi:hypothetical protein